MPNTLPEWLEYIEQQHPRSIELGLDRVRAVAARMGLEAPARRVITVGGTNGKGSTVALIRAIAEAAGLKVHAYTSPHLVRFNERIRLAGHLIEDDRLNAILDRVEAAGGEAGAPAARPARQDRAEHQAGDDRRHPPEQHGADQQRRGSQD